MFIMNQTTDKILKQIYYDSKNVAGFSSQKKLWLEAKKQLPRLKLTTVKTWWKHDAQNSCNLHYTI